MLDLLLVYACVAILSAGIATGTYRTVRRFSGAADCTTFVREMNSIGINATDVAKLVNADITSLFDLVKKKPNFVQNIGFSKPNAKALLKAAKKLKAFGDGQIKKYKKKEKQLQNKVERMGMVYTPLSLAPTFSFYDLTPIMRLFLEIMKRWESILKVISVKVILILHRAKIIVSTYVAQFLLV